MLRELLRATFVSAFFAAGAIFAGFTTFAHAAELIIQDTAGFTRANQDVGAISNLQFSVSAPSGTGADGALVTLTSTETGETLTAVASGGTVSFDGISPGVWTVASTTPGLTFTDISITSSLLGATGAAGISAVGAGAVAAVAGTGIAIAAAADNSNSESDVSPSS